MNMENSKYLALKEYLKGVLKTAKKLGLNVQSGGGYSMGYDINNIPPYPVGLFGALSIVEGPGARCKLGLTFDETQSLESGFNGSYPDTKNKKKKKRRDFKVNTELVQLGSELTFMLHRPRLRGASSWRELEANVPASWNELELPNEAIIKKKAKVQKLPAAPADGDLLPLPVFLTKPGSVEQPIHVSFNTNNTKYSEAIDPFMMDKILEKKKQFQHMAVEAQPAPIDDNLIAILQKAKEAAQQAMQIKADGFSFEKLDHIINNGQ